MDMVLDGPTKVPKSMHACPGGATCSQDSAERGSRVGADECARAHIADAAACSGNRRVAVVVMVLLARTHTHMPWGRWLLQVLPGVLLFRLPGPCWRVLQRFCFCKRRDKCHSFLDWRLIQGACCCRSERIDQASIRAAKGMPSNCEHRPKARRQVQHHRKFAGCRTARGDCAFLCLAWIQSI